MLKAEAETSRFKRLAPYPNKKGGDTLLLSRTELSRRKEVIIIVDKFKVLFELVLKFLQIATLTIQLVVFVRGRLRAGTKNTSKPPE